jgi:flagellar hook-associated protein 3 FlgL
MQKNKVAYNKYLNQYNTQKKIQRPSDDPTVAVRALKYRTTLSEIDQYLTNIKDATSWMDATETCLKQVNERLNSMIDYCTQAATGTYNEDDRKDIVTQLQQFSAYIYEQNANADYAGRYLFTGFRTDVPMLFDSSQTNVTYTITENVDVNNINNYQYVYGEATYDANSDASAYAAQASQFETAHRALLSYDDLDTTQAVTVTYTDSSGAEVTVNAITKSIADDTTYNEHLHPGDNEVYFVPETGELVFGNTVYDSVRAGKNLSVEYKKTNFEKNDVRPEHYFNCSTVDNDTGETAVYGTAGSQNMMYQINFSQTLTVNTEGCDSIDLSVGRAIEDVANICNDLDVMEANLTSVEKRISDCSEADTTTLANLNELKNQIETEISLQKTVLTDTLSATITTCQDAKDKLNVALADHGSRYNRMTMTKSQLENQQLDVEEAKSDNEDADLGEAYINFSEADLLYQATLQGTSKILGQSLLNFI